MKKLSSFFVISALNFSLLGGGASACPALDIEQVNNILQIGEYIDNTGTWLLHDPQRTDYQYPLSIYCIEITTT
jgi:hypothetical protein